MAYSADSGRSPSGTALFVRHTLIVLALVGLALFLWRVAHALLLAFAALLFAVLLRGVASKVSSLTGLGMAWSLAIVVALLVVVLVLAGALVGPAVAGQFGQLSETVTKALGQVQSYLEQSAWGQQVLKRVSSGMSDGGSVVSRAAQLLGSAVDGLLALVLVLVGGLYFALAPHRYVEGFVALLPRAYHERGRNVLHTTGNALWLWLLGQFIVMAVVGVLTALGLLLIGVPLAFTLGLISGLLEFVPFLGPLVAAVPVLLVAITVSPQTALYAALVLLAIQQVESNALEPLVQRKVASLPPVLVLFAAIAFWLVFGVAGAILATPLLLVIVVMTKMLYMEDTLHERTQVPGKPPG